MSSVQMDYSKVEPFIAIPDAVLSEGVSYVSSVRNLIWVDIYRARVYRRKMDTGEIRVFQGVGSGSIGAVFPILKKFDNREENVEEFLFAAKEGIAHGRFGGSWEYILKYSESGLDPRRLERLRSNDGNVCGENIYIGLMNDFGQEVTNEGVILKINITTKKIDLFWPKIAIPNSIYWVGEYTFITDSKNGCIWRTKGGFEEREKFIVVAEGEPDGSCLDRNGELLFVSIWGYSKVQVFSTKDGALKNEILLPMETPRVSCCAVVGSDLIVSTGNENMDSRKVERASFEGCLYRLRNVIPEEDEFSTRGIIYRDE